MRARSTIALFATAALLALTQAPVTSATEPASTTVPGSLPASSPLPVSLPTVPCSELSLVLSPAECAELEQRLRKAILPEEGPPGPGGEKGKTGPSGPSGPGGSNTGPGGEVLGAKASLRSGFAKVYGSHRRLRISRGAVVIPIRCRGAAGLLCRSRLFLAAGKWSARRAFTLHTGRLTHWVRVKLPRGLVRAVARAGRDGRKAYVVVLSRRIAKTAVLRRAIVTLIG